MKGNEIIESFYSIVHLSIWKDFFILMKLKNKNPYGIDDFNKSEVLDRLSSRREHNVFMKL